MAEKSERGQKDKRASIAQTLGRIFRRGKENRFSLWKRAALLNIDIPALHFYVDEDNEIVIEEMEVMPDHVHVLISFPPGEVPTSAIKALKDRNAFIFLRRHPEIRRSQSWGGHLWSPGYYISTSGNMSKEAVEKHINDQKYNEMKKAPYRAW